MKKDTLYEIYSILKYDTKKITDSLYKLMVLNSIGEEIFLKFCKNNSINGENFDFFIDISDCLSEITTKEIQDELTNSIIDISNDDYIINNVDYNWILEHIIHLLDYDYINLFEVYSEDEVDYYKSTIVKDFIKFLQTMKNIDISKVYSHDMRMITNCHKMVISGLYNTTSNNNEISFNQMCLERNKAFMDIISDKDIYEMEDDKFICMLNVIKMVENVEELKRLKNIIKIYRQKETFDFACELDDKASDLNELTISRISNELGFEKINMKKNSMIDKTLKFMGIRAKSNSNMKVDVNRSVEDTSEELEIIEKILKPLD